MATEEKPDKGKSHKTEIIIAAIGLVGVLGAAFIAKVEFGSKTQTEGGPEVMEKSVSVVEEEPPEGRLIDSGLTSELKTSHDSKLVGKWADTKGYYYWVISPSRDSNYLIMVYTTDNDKLAGSGDAEIEGNNIKYSISWILDHSNFSEWAKKNRIYPLVPLPDNGKLVIRGNSLSPSFNSPDYSGTRWHLLRAE